jgi:TonB family protein
VDAVTPILVDRAREPDGLRRMITISLGVHVVASVVLLLMPAPALRDDTPRQVMTISLGGAQGVRNGGMTTMAGQAKVAETVPSKPIQMPAASKAPEMVLPKFTTKPEAAKPAPKQAPDASRTRPAPKAAEAQAGSTPLDTGAKGAGFAGLTTGGGGTSGYLDVQNFCCPDYLTTMIQLIQQNWSGKQTVAGRTLMKFTIARDGRITDVQMEQSSGYFALDQTSQRALLLTRQLPPLPPAFTEPALTVHLNFQYER